MKLHSSGVTPNAKISYIIFTNNVKITDFCRQEANDKKAKKLQTNLKVLLNGEAGIPPTESLWENPGVQFYPCNGLVPIKSGFVSVRYKLFLKAFGGEAGIRTRGTVLPVRRFSKPLVSATHPPLQAEKKSTNNWRWFSIPTCRDQPLTHLSKLKKNLQITGDGLAIPKAFGISYSPTYPC